jgi:hypothetical protein
MSMNAGGRTPTEDLPWLQGRTRASIRRRGATMLMLAAMLTACGRVDVEWKEEVRLNDGRVVIVNRTAQGKALGEIGGPGGWRATRMTVEIDQPRLPSNPPTWSERWVPMLFDYDADTREWFVVATFYTCRDSHDLGRPKLPYLQYRTRDGRWEQVPLDRRLFGRKANLLTGVNARGEPPLVTIDEKEIRDRGAGKKYGTIVDSWANPC